MPHFSHLTARALVLPLENVDTDQIIPARFLKVTDKAGLGAGLFADWRYAPDGSPVPDFVLNRPESQGAQVLVTGDNFGCGSSREHAPWALAGFGFRAVISTSFADIFRSNALKNGLLPVAIPPETHRELLDMLAEMPRAELAIDLETQTVHLPNGQAVEFPIDGFSKRCLLQGVDQLGYLLSFAPQIAAFEQMRSS